MWLEGLMNALSFSNLLWLGIGTIVGLIVGVLPALGPNFGVALMLPFTFGMDPATAIIFLVAIHAACNYGDSVASIMVNIPGGPGTVATCWDGYPLAQQGKGAMALGIATFSSFFGGVGTWLFLAFMVGPIKKFALAIGAPEYFALGLMALGLISVASPKDTIKGLVMAFLGLALSTVGQDQATGLTFRYSYGSIWLEGGIPLVASTLGLFAISQIALMLEEGGAGADVTEAKGHFLTGLWESVKRPLCLFRAGAVGWAIGLMPALGVSLAGIAAYFTEKKYSKERDQFGKGSPSGLVAAEVGKGACVVGDLVPTFTLGVPGSVTGAILMAGLIIQGIEPGPRFLTSGSLPYTVFVGIVLAQASFLVSGMVLGKLFVSILRVPNIVLAPIITVLTFAGAFAERSNTMDFIILLVFGVLAYVLVKLKYPVVCLVLGLILGPLIEANLHRSLGISFGSYWIFVTRPTALMMLSITLCFLTLPYLWSYLRRHRRNLTYVEKVSIGAQEGQRSPGEELILLGVISFVMVAFLITGQGYSFECRLFPCLVAGATLFFVLLRFLSIVRSLRFNFTWIRGAPLFADRLSWKWSFGTMVGYGALVPILGFVFASAVYVSGVVFLAGHRKWSVIILSGIGTAIGAQVFMRIAQLQPPLGIFGLLS